MGCCSTANIYELMPIPTLVKLNDGKKKGMTRSHTRGNSLSTILHRIEKKNDARREVKFEQSSQDAIGSQLLMKRNGNPIFNPFDLKPHKYYFQSPALIWFIVTYTSTSPTSTWLVKKCNTHRIHPRFDHRQRLVFRKGRSIYICRDRARHKSCAIK